MAMQTDVKSVQATATGALLTYRARIRSLVITCSATAGDIVVNDSATAASGEELLRITTVASTTVIVPVLFPGEGIMARNGVYITLPASVKVTVMYA